MGPNHIRERVRQALVITLDGYRGDGDLAPYYSLKSAILELFDQNDRIKGVAEMGLFSRLLVTNFPKVDWSLFGASLELELSSLIERLPHQSVASVALALTIEGQEINGGKTKIGGSPDWIQEPSPANEHPVCSGCNEVMAFFFQLDSFASVNKGKSVARDFSFADRGMFYFFGCKKCGSSHSSFDSY